MSSFKRRIPSKSATAPVNPSDKHTPAQQQQQPATEPSLLSGLSTIDDLLGSNGLARGHTLLVRTPDPHSAWGLMVSRYALAQGLVSGDAVVVIAHEDDASDLVAGCMWTGDRIEDSAVDGEDVDPEMEPEGGVKIAWRYAKMKQFSTTVPKRAGSGGIDQESAAFELTMRIPPDVISHSQNIGQLTTIPLPPPSNSNISACTTVLQHIHKLTQSLRSDPNTSAHRAVRIIIPDLGNPSWGDLQPPHLIRFLLALRSLIRGTSAAAFIALSSTLSTDTWGGPGWAGKLSHVSDGCITLTGFGDDPTSALSFPTHHGLVKIASSPSPGTLRAPSINRSILRGLTSSGPHGGGENNLAFRCTRKRLVIETMHLGAEGGVGARQTTAPTDAAAQPDSHSHSHPHPAPAPRPAPAESARVSIALDDADPVLDIPVEEAAKGKKGGKAKQRRVVFQSDKPEIYDF